MGWMVSQIVLRGRNAMRMLIYADPHWCRTSSILRSYGEYHTTRLENLIKSINFVEELAVAYGCDTILCLGDFFDRANLDAEEITALRDVRFSEGIEHIFLVGNHDAYNMDNSVNISNIFGLSEDFRIIDKPYVIKERGNTGDIELCFWPYNRESEKVDLSQIFGEFNKGTTRYIFSHNDIKGVQYGAAVSTVGIDLQYLTENCTACFNGHIHNGGIVSRNVTNVGNLTGLNFSEDAFKYKHRCIILDTLTGEAKSITNPYALNFIKMDCKESSWEETELPDNVVVSASCYIDDVDAVQKWLSEKNVLSSKVTSVKKDMNEEDETVSIEKPDHLQMFYKYVMENIGADDITKEEAQKVIGGIQA